MPQAWLPLIPSGSTPINDVLSVEEKNRKWIYFCGVLPVFFHDKDDQRSFRMFTAQLVCQGMCTQAQIIKAFGVSKSSVNRSVEKYQTAGVNAFFKPRKGRGGSVLTDEVKDRAQQLLNLGKSRREVAGELGIKYDTLRKAINQGRLSEPSKAKQSGRADTSSRSIDDAKAEMGVGCTRPLESVTSVKSSRSIDDAKAEMGVGCTRPLERVAAALGLLPEGAPTRFEPCLDVSFGGVLCALPALVANGLFSHIHECFETLTGYYTNLQVLLLLAYMALCRIKTIEQLQYHCPGELGKLMGLDRVPEVRCLRKKLSELSKDDAPEKWSGLLSRDWLQSSAELAAALYVDGHVRVYHGYKTKLPKRFVSRERLCLRGTTDYWVNDALGQPFFVVNRPVDRGLLEALRTDIVPQLLQDVPGQPSDEELSNDPHRCRFIMLFDREGYSPAFLKQMWQEHRIACITYHKYPKDTWPQEWFVDTKVEMPSGELLTMKLAEMGSWVGDDKSGLWVREVRKLSDNGHQTSLISSAKSATGIRDAALLFSRWSQENFFAYMVKHYALDLLSEYGTEEFPGKQPVINPQYRQLDREHRSVKSKLTHRLARYAALELHPQMEDKKVAKYNRKKADLVEEIEQLEHDLGQLKEALAQTPKHIDWDNLPEEDKFERLKPSRKRLTDTIKMIAYRAETAMVNIVREKLSRNDDARSLIRDLCNSEADIVPNIETGVLTIQVHSMANPRANRAIEHLLEHLNDSEFNYPGTKLRLLFRMVY